MVELCLHALRCVRGFGLRYLNRANNNSEHNSCSNDDDHDDGDYYYNSNNNNNNNNAIMENKSSRVKTKLKSSLRVSKMRYFFCVLSRYSSLAG
jgi:hypothetical protein